MFESLNNELCANLIHNLTVLRRQYSLSKTAMAKLLGISLYSLNILKAGKLPSQLSVEMLFRAQTCFDISIRDLFGQRL